MTLVSMRMHGCIHTNTKLIHTIVVASIGIRTRSTYAERDALSLRVRTYIFLGRRFQSNYIMCMYVCTYVVFSCDVEAHDFLAAENIMQVLVFPC